MATPRKGDWRPATQGQPQRGAEGPVAAEQRERPRESVGSAEEATCVGPARWGAGTFVHNAQGSTRLQASERNLRGDSGRWRGQRKYRTASTKVRLCGVGGIVVSIAVFQAVDLGSIPDQRKRPVFLRAPGLLGPVRVQELRTLGPATWTQDAGPTAACESGTSGHVVFSGCHRQEKGDVS